MFKNGNSLQINFQVQFNLRSNPQMEFPYGPWETDSKANPEKKMDNG